MQIYTEYISKFDKALKALDEWTKKSPQFAEVVHEFEAQPKCASIPIAGYMLDVVQRITRYKMLMSGKYAYMYNYSHLDSKFNVFAYDKYT